MAKPRRTLIVTEKPSQARSIIKGWEAVFPNDVITRFYTPPIGSFLFHLPRDLPIAEVPIIAEPVLKPRSFERLNWSEVSSLSKNFGDVARAADHIVCATDFDATGCRNFLELMRYYEINKPLHEVSWLGLQMEDFKSVVAAIKRDWRADHPDFTRMAAIGHARRYFDYLYLINALPVFGRALRMAGLDTEGSLGFMSKYSLQTLLMLLRLGTDPLPEGRLITLMRKNPLSKKGSQIGSPISRPEILSWLERSGCMERIGAGESNMRLFVVSDRGRRLARLLHKDCLDPDLGHRLEDWGATWPESKPRIERYIRTYFGKQKRFLASFA